MAISAQELLINLEKIYGPSIFKAILENHDSRYVDDFDRFKREQVKPRDFIYNPTGQIPQSNLGMGLGSGTGPLAGALKPNEMNQEVVMTRAPWAK